MDTFSIGICAEDAEAGRVVAAALAAGCRPIFYNARGTFVDMRFMPSQRVKEPSTPKEPFPLLYGWIERMSADTIVQLVDPVPPTREPIWFMGGTGEGLPKSQANASPSLDVAPDCFAINKAGGRESAGRVVGSLSFLLHLLSTPLQEQAQDITPVDSILAEEDIHGRDSSTVAQTAHSTKVSPPPLSLLTPKGKPVGSALTVEQAAMEQRDDCEVVRNAVETVLCYSQLVTEHLGSSGSVYVDESTGCEYIKFGH